jgi:diadenosine tetraphosphate (Ap4A) HIT family hydrolase
MTPRWLLYETAHFTVEQSEEAVIPGYLVLRAKATARSLSDLPVAALAELGLLLARATRAIETVIEPERVYCLRLGEAVEQVHFHLFPRTAALGALFRGEHPTNGAINAALLFDWARRPEVVARIPSAIAIEPAVHRLKTIF